MWWTCYLCNAVNLLCYLCHEPHYICNAGELVVNDMLFVAIIFVVNYCCISAIFLNLSIIVIWYWNLSSGKKSDLTFGLVGGRV